MTEHCSDINADRDLGQIWERHFCQIAANFGLCFSPLQIGRQHSAQAYFKNQDKWQRVTLPDVTIWSSPGQHHEIKHKSPTEKGLFGLEKYRFDCLKWFSQETDQNVFYTIHNHALNGGRQNKKNCLEHWFSARINDLDSSWVAVWPGYSWINGEKKKTDIIYWDISLWSPLSDVLRQTSNTPRQQSTKEESDLEAADAELEKIKSELARERQERKRHYKDWFGKGKSQARSDNLQAYSEWSQT